MWCACRRVVVQVEVFAAPKTHLLPHFVMPRNTLFVTVADKHVLIFKAPSKPRLRVLCQVGCALDMRACAMPRAASTHSLPLSTYMHAHPFTTDRAMPCRAACGASFVWLRAC